MKLFRMKWMVRVIAFMLCLGMIPGLGEVTAYADVPYVSETADGVNIKNDIKDNVTSDGTTSPDAVAVTAINSGSAEITVKDVTINNSGFTQEINAVVSDDSSVAVTAKSVDVQATGSNAEASGVCSLCIIIQKKARPEKPKTRQIFEKNREAVW